MKNKTFLISFLVFIYNICYCQDPHLSFYSALPNFINPAYTGNFNGNVKIGGQYRDQWASVLGGEEIGSYKTALTSVDIRTNRGIEENDIVGFGLNMMYDIAGQSRLTNSKLGLSGSYRKALDQYGDNFISIGGQVAMMQKKINISGLKWGTQWDAVNYRYDGTLPDFENNNLDDNIIFYDFSAGIVWGYKMFSTRNSINAGLSLLHINEPNESFYTNDKSINGSAKLPMRINFNAGANIQVNDKFDIMPKILFMKQNNNYENVLGTEVKYLLEPKEEYGNSVYLGFLSRIVGGDKNILNSKSLVLESLIATLRYEYNNFEIGGAYDFNVSKLTTVSTYQGGFEIYLTYAFKLKSNLQKKMYCPKI